MIGDLWDLSGRTAIVTGASSGLGVTFSEALAGAGADVVVAARRSDRLEELAGRIEALGGRALAVTCDVADPGQVAGVARAAVDRFGRLDMMVCNAGTAGDAGPMAEQLPHELFEWTVRVNLLGHWYGCRDAGAVMLAQGSGSIVNVASTAGLGGIQHFPPAYQASKAAVINLTRNLALSWAGRGRAGEHAGAGLVPQRDGQPLHRGPGLWRPHRAARADGQGRRPGGADRAAAVPGVGRVEPRQRGTRSSWTAATPSGWMGTAVRPGALRLPCGGRPRRPRGADRPSIAGEEASRRSQPLREYLGGLLSQVLDAPGRGPQREDRAAALGTVTVHQVQAFEQVRTSSTRSVPGATHAVRRGRGRDHQRLELADGCGPSAHRGATRAPSRARNCSRRPRDRGRGQVLASCGPPGGSFSVKVVVLAAPPRRGGARRLVDLGHRLAIRAKQSGQPGAEVAAPIATTALRARASEASRSRRTWAGRSQSLVPARRAGRVDHGGGIRLSVGVDPHDDSTCSRRWPCGFPSR